MTGDSDKIGYFDVSCHCNRVRGRFVCNDNKLLAWDCNCSDCSKRGNIHIIIPERDFQIAMPSSTETFEDATTLYQWGTKAAKRRFCKTCGILAWYTPRSNPDVVAITLNCIDWGEQQNLIRPQVNVKKFDGINWEESFHSSKITNQSQQHS